MDAKGHNCAGVGCVSCKLQRVKIQRDDLARGVETEIEWLGTEGAAMVEASGDPEECEVIAQAIDRLRALVPETREHVGVGRRR